MTGVPFGEICRSVMQTGLVLLLQMGLILLLGLGGAWTLRRHGPQAQSLACQATLLAVLLVALLSPALVHGQRALWRVPFPSAAPVPPAARTVTSPVPASVPAAVKSRSIPMPRPNAKGNTGVVGAPSAPPVPASGSNVTHTVCFLAAGLWLAGTVALLAWLGLGQASLMLLRRRSIAATGEAQALLTHLCAARGLAAPRLVVSPRVAGPFLAGLWRPAIFLPATYAQDFDSAALRAVLAHELGHLERRDNAWMLLGRVTCALFWPQPLLWSLSRRMAQASEEACDALALAQGCSPRAYADCLLSLAERRSFSLGERAVGVGLVSVRSAVGRRIQTILARKAHAMPTISSRFRAAVLAGAGAAALAAALLVSSSAPAQPAAPSLIGTWRGEDSGKRTDTVTFRSDGTITEAQAGFRTDGVYQVTGDSLTVTMTSSQAGGGKRQPITSTPAKGLHVRVNGDTLTLFDKNGQQGVLSRVADSVAEEAPSPNLAGLGVIRADNTPVWAGRNAKGRMLSRLSTGQGVAIGGETADDYAVLMNNDIGYVAKSAVRLLGFGAAPVSPGQTPAQRIVQAAESYLGVPFVPGGAARAGIDDTGLVRAAYAAAGIDLPQQATAQAAVGADVPRGEPSAWAPGDRLYFALHGPDIDHAGLYLGAGLFLHASPAHGRQVAIDHVADAAYAPHLVSVRRSQELISAPAPPPTPAANASAGEADLLAGLTPVQGPGLSVTLRDSKKPLPGGVNIPGNVTLIHDTDIEQVVNELKAAGAEAIAINDQRLVGMSPIRSVGPVIDVNGVPQAPPFVIKSIGDARTMRAALNLRGGVADMLRRYDPAMISLQPSPALTLPAYSGTAQPRYAHPVLAQPNGQH